LTWAPATDPAGISAYNIYVNGQLFRTVSGSSQHTTLSGLPSGGTVSFAVQAVNNNGITTWDGPTQSVALTRSSLTANNTVLNPGNETTGSAAMGMTGGGFSVTADGAASYVIPIFAPDGPGGLKPSIALTYNSNAGTSSPVVGVGWSL